MIFARLIRRYKKNKQFARKTNDKHAKKVKRTSQQSHRNTNIHLHTPENEGYV